MSKRAVKKLIEQRQLEQQESEVKVQQILPVRKNKNFFNSALLNNNDSDSNEEQETQEQNSQQDNNKTQDQVQKQKRNKKKKNKKRAQEQQEIEVQYDKDLEFLEQQQIQNIEERKEQEQLQLAPSNLKIQSTLEIICSKLNYKKELQKHFKDLKITEEASKVKGPKTGRSQLKTQKLVQNQNQNPPPFRFQCEQTDLNDQGLRVFQFKASNSYEALQRDYQTVKNTMNPQQIFDFLQFHPFHCEALYDVSEFFRLKGDYKQANELLEALLTIYEKSLGFEFGKILTDGPITMELDINSYSQTFLMTLFKFTDILDKKGCYRSALEFTKVLLKANPAQDITGALFLIDFHSLSSQQFDYLLYFTSSFCQELYKSSKYSLLLMPNYLYNCALAKYLQEKEEHEKIYSKDDFQVRISDDDFEQALNNLSNNSTISVKSNILLIQAILLYPSAIFAIAEKNEWTKFHIGNFDSFRGKQRLHLKELLQLDFLQKESYYYWFLGLENDDDNDGLKKTIEIFIERNKRHWKHQYIAQWVKGIIGLIQNKIDEKKLDLIEFYNMISCQQPNQKTQNLIPFQFRRYKNLVKSHFSDKVERLDFNNLFAENIGAQQQVQQHPQFNPVNQNQGLLGALFGTLLPWVHSPQAAEQIIQQIDQQDEINDDLE